MEEEEEEKKGEKTQGGEETQKVGRRGISKGEGRLTRTVWWEKGTGVWRGERKGTRRGGEWERRR